MISKNKVSQNQINYPYLPKKIMCGIVCALNVKKTSPKLRSEVLEMSKKLRHRGPDWNGIYSDENVILAHERLAIVDPKSGKQPLLKSCYDNASQSQTQCCSMRFLGLPLLAQCALMLTSLALFVARANRIYNGSRSEHVMIAYEKHYHVESTARQRPVVIIFPSLAEGMFETKAQSSNLVTSNQLDMIWKRAHNANADTALRAIEVVVATPTMKSSR